MKIYLFSDLENVVSGYFSISDNRLGSIFLSQINFQNRKKYTLCIILGVGVSNGKVFLKKKIAHKTLNLVTRYPTLKLYM